MKLFMGKKKEYKETNRMFLKRLASQEGVFVLPGGIYYKVLKCFEYNLLCVCLCVSDGLLYKNMYKFLYFIIILYTY